MSTIRSSQRVGWSFCRSSRCPGLSIWKHPSVSEARISSNVGSSSSRDRVEVDLHVLGPGDLVQRVAHRREHPHAEDVELQVAEELDVVLVGLDHPVALERALERDPGHEVVVREHDARGVERDVAREAVETLGHAEQVLELAGVQVRAGELGQALDRHAEVAARRCAGTTSRRCRPRARADRGPCRPRGPRHGRGRCRPSRRTRTGRRRSARAPCRRRPRAGRTRRRRRCRGARRASGSGTARTRGRAGPRRRRRCRSGSRRASRRRSPGTRSGSPSPARRRRCRRP